MQRSQLASVKLAIFQPFPSHIKSSGTGHMGTKTFSYKLFTSPCCAMDFISVLRSSNYIKGITNLSEHAQEILSFLLSTVLRIGRFKTVDF